MLTSNNLKILPVNYMYLTILVPQYKSKLKKHMSLVFNMLQN